MRKFYGACIFLLGLAAVLSAQTITVTKPALNETWVKGQTCVITWTKSGNLSPGVKISLRDKDSLTVVLEIVDPAPNSGSYSWAVPAGVPDGQYRIRVKAKGVEVFGDSPVFNIAAAAPGGLQMQSGPQNAGKTMKKKPLTQAPSVGGDKVFVKSHEVAAAIKSWNCTSYASNIPPSPTIFQGRSQCAGFNQYADAGYDFFTYPDGSVTSWAGIVHRSQVNFALGQFQGKGPDLLEAKLHLKRVSDTRVNTTRSCCAAKLWVFLAPWTDCLNAQTAFLMDIPDISGEIVLDVTGQVRKWIDGTMPNGGFLLTGPQESILQTQTICLSCFEAGLTLKFKI